MSTHQFTIRERISGLVGFKARVLAAIPGRSLNNRIYTKEVLQQSAALYEGKPFIMDHNIEDSDAVIGIFSRPRYATEVGMDGRPYEGLWLDAVGLMDENLFDKVNGRGLVPPLVRGFSIGGEGDGDFQADGGILIRSFIPAEGSITPFPGIPAAHIAAINAIRESYLRNHSDEVKKTSFQIKEKDVSLEEAGKQAAKQKERKAKEKIREGPLPGPDSQVRALRGQSFPKNDVRPGLPAPTVRKNMLYPVPQPTTSTDAGYKLNPQDPTGTSGTMPAGPQGLAVGSGGISTGPPVNTYSTRSPLQTYGSPGPQAAAPATGAKGFSTGPPLPPSPYGTASSIPGPLAGGAPGSIQNLTVVSDTTQEQTPGTVPSGPSSPDARPYPGLDGIVTAASTTVIPPGPQATSLTDAAQDVGLGQAGGPRDTPMPTPSLPGRMFTPGGQVSNQTTTTVPAVAAGSLTDAAQAAGAGKAGGPRASPMYPIPRPYNNPIMTPATGTTTTDQSWGTPTGNPYPPGSSSAIAQSANPEQTREQEGGEEEGGEEEEDGEEEGGEEEGEEGVDPIRKAAGQGQRAVVQPDTIPIEARAFALPANAGILQMLARMTGPKQATDQQAAELIAAWNRGKIPQEQPIKKMIVRRVRPNDAAAKDRSLPLNARPAPGTTESIVRTRSLTNIAPSFGATSIATLPIKRAEDLLKEEQLKPVNGVSYNNAAKRAWLRIVPELLEVR